jgi:hypothetical protein
MILVGFQREHIDKHRFIIVLKSLAGKSTQTFKYRDGGLNKRITGSSEGNAGAYSCPVTGGSK